MTSVGWRAFQNLARVFTSGLAALMQSRQCEPIGDLHETIAARRLAAACAPRPVSRSGWR